MTPGARHIDRFLSLSLSRRAAAVIAAAVATALIAHGLHGFDRPRTAELLALLATVALTLPALGLNEAARARKRLANAIADERAAEHDSMTQREREAIAAEVNRLVTQHHMERDASLEWTPGTELALYLGLALILAASGGKLLLGG
jgi:hypothetical protein